jgi:hypothetical protein
LTTTVSPSVQAHRSDVRQEVRRADSDAAPNNVFSSPRRRTAMYADSFDYIVVGAGEPPAD